MKAVISGKKEIAKGTLLVDFKVFEGKVKFKPGQFVNVKLINPPYTDAEGNDRYFSIISRPNAEESISIATRISQSAFKRFLLEAPFGAEVNLGEPMGEFLLSGSPSGQVVFIAGGIGIAPFVSILRYAKEENLGYKITLIYSNKDKESTAFLEELEDYKKEDPNFNLILTMTADPDWLGEKRTIDAQFIKDYTKNPESFVYFVSGPPAMVQNITDVLLNLGVKGRNIKTDSLTGY